MATLDHGKKTVAVVTKDSRDSPDMQLFILVFLSTLILGLFLQLVILPFILPQFHAGHGLIVGGDWVLFHKLAMEQAEEVLRHGWGGWQLRPEGQAPAGIASAIYVLTTPQPYVFLPINALAFACAVLAARSCLTGLGCDLRTATLSIMPFLIFPSFAMVWGQIHKDVFVGAGTLLILDALVRATNHRDSTFWLAIETAAGSLLVWAFRPYALEIICATSAVFFFIQFIFRQNVARIVTVLTVLLLGTITEFALEGMSGLSGAFSPVNRTHEASSHSEPTEVELVCRPTPTNSLDRLMHSVCAYRAGFLSRYPDAASNLKDEPTLRHLSDFVSYLPRAIEIAIFQPVPFTSRAPTSPVGTIGRRFVSVEMTISYVAFVAAVFFAWRRLLSVRFISLMAFLASFATIYAYISPNIGTVFRERIFVHTLLACAFLATIIDTFHRPTPQFKHPAHS